MFILDIKSDKKEWKISKTVIGYMLITLAAIVINKVYALFGHGVSSDSMTYMFLYPLIGGVIFYTLIKLIFPHVYQFHGYRLFFNLHNSGIAALTTGSLFEGILEIAGTNSSFTKVFFTAGWIFIGIGIIILAIISIKSRHQ